MQALYGKRWIEEYGPEPHPAWIADLRSMTPSEAAMGWKACKDAGEQERHVPTLPVFLARVKSALKERAARTTTHRALPGPPSSQEQSLADMVEAKRTEAKAGVDVERLKRALGHKNVRVAPLRRTILRGEIHPAGRFDLRDVEKAKRHCKDTGRSWQDMELELMAHNGWSPDDERALPLHERRDKGSRPFEEAWLEAESNEEESKA